MKNFFVYALKDPRTARNSIFYIGKGTGSRHIDHLVTKDSTRRSIFIQSLAKEGFDPIVTILVDELTESESIKIEAQLISTFGTIESGGSLVNTVVPTGVRISKRREINHETGSVDKAQIGLRLLKEAIVEVARANVEGVSNAELAETLGLRSSHEGKQKDYLTYSLIGLLLSDGAIEKY